MKKRLISALAALTLLCILALPVIAAGNAVSAEADKTTLERGDRVTVTVDFSCGEAVSTVSALLEFDSAVFQLIEGTCNEQLGAVFTSFNEEHSGLALLFSDAKPREGKLGVFVLEVKAAATYGETTIRVKPVFKSGAEELTADSAELKFTVGCVHSWSDWSKAGSVYSRTCSRCNETEQVTHGDADHVWDAQGVCVHCRAQKPAEPTTPPATSVPMETTAPQETELIETTAPIADGATQVTTETTEQSVASTENGGAEEQKPATIWWLLLLPVIGGCIAAVVLLKKKR